MPDDFTGTSTEKIDKLVAAVVELRTTMRICLAIVGIGFPLMISLLAFLVLQSFNTSARVEQLVSPVAKVQGDYDRLSERASIQTRTI